MTIDVQNSLGLLSASRAGEHLSLVTEVPEVVVRFGSFRQRGELAAVRTGWSLFPVNTFRLSIFHEAYPQINCSIKDVRPPNDASLYVLCKSGRLSLRSGLH